MDDSIYKNIIEEEVKLAKTSADEEWTSTYRRIDIELRSVKRKICKKIKLTKGKAEQIWESAIDRIAERIKRVHEDGSSTSLQRRMKLLFKNRISHTILTGEEIKGDDNTYIELNLVDDPTGEIVEIGPESSANVEIVLLKAEYGASESSSSWTVEEFNMNIARDSQGKTDFLTGNVNIKLHNGVAILNNIKLKNRASELRPPVFTLGARVVESFDGVAIRETKTESFTVEIYRKKYFKKHEIPSLTDEVYRLINIWKDGAVHKRLEENSINTVEDFLVLLMIDPKGLESITKLQGKKFGATVDHARACQTGQRNFCYMNSVQSIGVVFDILGTILGLYNDHQYTTGDSLSENHKVVAEGLFKLALENWKDTVSVKDDEALREYFTSLRPSLEPVQSLHNSIKIRDTTGESSNSLMHSPLQSFDSAMNWSNEEPDINDFGSSFWFDGDEKTDYHFPWPDSPCSRSDGETMLQALMRFLTY